MDKPLLKVTFKDGRTAFGLHAFQAKALNLNTQFLKKGAHVRFRKANTSDLSNDLSQLLDDLQDILTSKGRCTDPAAALLFNKAASTLGKMRSTSSTAISGSKAVAQSANAYLHDSPWRALSGALAVGALLGLFLSKR